MGKRGNGEGGISRRKDGLYMARYTVHTATGAKRKAVYGKTRKEAAEKLTKALADRDMGLVLEGENRTLAAFLDGWLEGTVKGSVKATTYESYERLIRCHIKPELGAHKLKTLAPDHVQALYQRKLDSGLAPGTVRQIHSVLSRALDQAVRWGTVPRNACKADLVQATPRKGRVAEHPLPRSPAHLRHAATLSRPPSQTRPSASWARFRGPYPRPLLSRPARHGGPDRRRDGSGAVLRHAEDYGLTPIAARRLLQPVRRGTQAAPRLTGSRSSRDRTGTGVAVSKRSTVLRSR
jgi:hypothetical protein